ncbi:GyrI-like domain-containing protein [Cohnella sp. REN36]|uniref:AraC family transcriptional regulator n=1 Tax=Cohnella sp. REN36 TaxID=2887347 RepID=UPI001D155B69|nr:GyrI-like domain-containing protein [Cohnella sp. REN36]MCC3376456.1 GyrI-like domain-containing protein [Cohnella sp. REN36]
MEASVEVFPFYRIAYVRHTGPYGSAQVQAMKQLKRWAREKGLLTESAILFGIPLDDPQTTPPEKCRYDACIVLAKEEPIDDAVCEGELVGGDYVVFKIRHSAEAIQNAWADVFSAVRRMGYRVDDRPDLEKYAGDLIVRDLCEICVPIKPV